MHLVRGIRGIRMERQSYVVAYCVVAMLMAACAYFLTITG